MTFAADTGQTRPPIETLDLSHAWSQTPLVPAETVAGKALAIVIAIMTFLAALTAGFAIVLAGASHEWRGEVGLEMTIQILPRASRDIEADVAKAAQIAAAFPGVAEARAFTRKNRKICWRPGSAPGSISASCRSRA